MERTGPPSIHAIGFAGVAASLLCAAAVLPIDAPPLSLFACPFRAATGLPCLTCGCTHAFAHVVRGEVLAAFLASPLGALLAIACALHVLSTCARLCGFSWSLRLPRSLLAPRLSRAAVLGALALNWIFLVARSRA